MNFKLLIVVMAILIGVAVSPFVMANESAVEAEDTNTETNTDQPIQLKEITVIGSKENTRNLPGSAAYLDTKDIRTHSYGDVNRVLRKVPGIYLREEDGYGLFPNVSLRGVDPGRSGKVSMMEDGILTAPAPYSAPSAYYSPTTGRMRGIEVLKGSSQIKYGPHTTGGVINYLSTQIPNKAAFYMKNLVGTNNEIRSHIHYGNKIQTDVGRFGFLIENYYRETDGFKTIDFEDDFQDVDRTGFRKYDTMLKLSFEPDSSLKQRIEAKIGYLDKKADETYLGITDEDFEDNPYRRYAASRFDNIKTNQLRSYLRYTAALTQAVNISVTGYYNDFHRNWFKLRGGGADLLDPEKLALFKGDASGTLKYRNNNRDYYLGGVQSNLNFNLNTGDISHAFDLGVRFHLDQIRRFQSNVEFEQDDGGNIINRTDKGPGSGGNRLQETTAIALSLQDKIGFGDLQITPGIRLEHANYNFTEFDAEGDPDKVILEGEPSSINILAPGIGVSYNISNELSTFAGIHSGFSTPGPRAHSKDGLTAETSVGSELGFRYNAKGLRTEAIFFYTDFNDLLVADNIAGGGVEGVTENVGNATSAGVEVLTAYDAGIANNWGFLNPYRISFTYTNATLDGDANSLDEESIFAGGKDGANVPYVPEIQFSVGTGIEFSKWGIFADVTYVDETFTTASNSAKPVDPNSGKPNATYGKTDSCFLIDVSGKYKISNSLSAFLNIHNLTNQAYIASRHPIGPRPGKPFNAALGIETRF